MSGISVPSECNSVCGLSPDIQLLCLSVFWKMGLRGEKKASLIVSFIRSFDNNSQHMGKRAHPFVGETWVGLPEACGTPLGLVR